MHGLLGGNGSGKSTLIKVLAGVHRGDPGGSIDLLGRTVASNEVTPKLARDCGLRFVHQNPAVFQSMTVAENMALGSSYPTTAGTIAWRALRRRARRMLERFEINARPDDIMSTLRQADQTMIAIARALDDGDSTPMAALILDEPTASLPDHEVELLLDAVRRFAGQGHTILYVSHRLDEVLRITDTVSVLRDGRHVQTRGTRTMTEGDLIEQIVGRRLRRERTATATDPNPHTAPAALEVLSLSGGPIRDASLRVARGEILGIAGLLGSGRTELLKMIFAAEPKAAGEIRLDGRPVDFRTIGDAMAGGIAYVPEDRGREGMFEALTVRENILIARVSTYWSGLRFDRRRERADTLQSMAWLSIKAWSDAVLISALSGGNQQKVVLARWLGRKPTVLLLDEPTQGIDVGAREQVYAAIRREVTERGMAAVVVSSDFEELVQLCHSVVVMRDGCLCETVRGADLNRHRLGGLVLAAIGQAA